MTTYDALIRPKKIHAVLDTDTVLIRTGYAKNVSVDFSCWLTFLIRQVNNLDTPKMFS